MAEWVEIPAHRILRVDHIDFRENYIRLDDNGEPCPQYCVPYRIVRRSDNKVFIGARFVPLGSEMLDVCYLEEA